MAIDTFAAFIKALEALPPDINKLEAAATILEARTRVSLA